MRDYVQRRVPSAKNIEPMLGESSARRRVYGKRCEKCAGPVSSYNSSRKCYACLAAAEKRAERSVEALYPNLPAMLLCKCGAQKDARSTKCKACHASYEYEKTCEGCGQVFMAMTERRKWCSPGCKSAYYKFKARAA